MRFGMNKPAEQVGGLEAIEGPGDGTGLLPYVVGRPRPLAVPPILKEVCSEEQFVLLETGRVFEEECVSYLFVEPLEILESWGPEDAQLLCRRVEEALNCGLYVAGWWSYEWGYALEERLNRLLSQKRPEGPLVRLGVYSHPVIWRHETGSGNAREAEEDGDPAEVWEGLGGLELNVSKSQYLEAVSRIKDWIRAGETYQVNYTLKARFKYRGDPTGLYLALRRQQAVSYGAILKEGERWILCLSPELFLRREGRRIWSKPMKGTVRRGLTTGQDKLLARALAADVKSRAENVMIVDLLRNDIGRLALPGTVHVRDLFQVERYDTLFQMVSRIEGVLRDGVTWGDLFRALFPCGSVTGAPKIRTMELIAAVEAEPRGVYTGSIGFLAPRGGGVLNVAIRTLVLERGSGHLGIGSGIVADSDPEAEYDECRLKARFVSVRRPLFQLVETLRWEEDRGFYLLERHLARMADSAHYFDFPFDREACLEALRTAVERTRNEAAGAGASALMVRLLLNQRGRFEAEAVALPHSETAEPVGVTLKEREVGPREVFLYHKTTHRPWYRKALEEAAAEGFFDVVFVDQAGRVIEGARSTIFVELEPGGILLTPPLRLGLLPGTLRAELIAEGRAREGEVTVQMLDSAYRVYVGNSVRGLLRCRVIQKEPVSRPGSEVDKGGGHR